MIKPELGLAYAASYAMTTRPDDRNFRLGAFGVRRDGVIVYSRNAACQCPTPSAHAEARIARKMGGGVVYVARVLRTGEWALARPCVSCINRLTSKYVTKVYYTIANEEYGCLTL